MNYEEHQPVISSDETQLVQTRTQPREVPSRADLIYSSTDSRMLLQQNAMSHQPQQHTESQQKIIVWGSNKNGQLGLGNGQDKMIVQPLKMPFMRPVTKVAIGEAHTAFITDQMQLFMAGDNQRGQLGLGSELIKNAVYPTMVTSLAQRHVIDVACGAHHTLALTNGKSLFSSGANDHGQLGINSDHQVFDFETHKLKGDAVFAGNNQSFVLTDSKVMACGDNTQGKLGLTNSQTSYKDFVQIAIGQVSAIATAEQSTVALLTSGRVLETTELDGFVIVPDLKNISQVAAGKVNGAIDAEGNLYTWKPQDPSAQKTVHGSLQDICIGDCETGLVRDKHDNLYQWGLSQSSFTKIQKQGSHIFQGGDSTIVIKRQTIVSPNLRQSTKTLSGSAVQEIKFKPLPEQNLNLRDSKKSYASSAAGGPQPQQYPSATQISKSGSLVPLKPQSTQYQTQTNLQSLNSNQFQTEAALAYEQPNSKQVISPTDSYGERPQTTHLRTSSSRPGNVYGSGAPISSKRSGQMSTSQVSQMNEPPLTTGHQTAHRTPLVRYDNNTNNPYIYEQPLTENYRHKSTGAYTAKTRLAQNEENIVPVYNTRGGAGQIRGGEDPVMTTASLSDLEHQNHHKAFNVNDALPLRSKERSRQKYHTLKQKSQKTIYNLQQEIARLKIENEDLTQKNDRFSHYQSNQSSRLDAITREEGYLRQVIAHHSQGNQELSDQLRDKDQLAVRQETQLKDQLFEITKLKDQLLSAQSHCRSYEAQLLEFQDSNQMLSDKIGQTKSKHQDWKLKYRKLVQDKCDLQKMVEDGNSHICQLQSTIDHLHIQVKNLTAQCKETTLQQQEADQEVQRVIKEKSAQQDQIERQEHQKQNLTKIIEELEMNNKSLIRYMDARNCTEAQKFTDEVSEILKQKRQSVSSLRNPNPQHPVALISPHKQTSHMQSPSRKNSTTQRPTMPQRAQPSMSPYRRNSVGVPSQRSPHRNSAHNVSQGPHYNHQRTSASPHDYHQQSLSPHNGNFHHRHHGPNLNQIHNNQVPAHHHYDHPDIVNQSSPVQRVPTQDNTLDRPSISTQPLGQRRESAPQNKTQMFSPPQQLTHKTRPPPKEINSMRSSHALPSKLPQNLQQPLRDKTRQSLHKKQAPTFANQINLQRPNFPSQDVFSKTQAPTSESFDRLNNLLGSNEQIYRKNRHEREKSTDGPPSRHSSVGLPTHNHSASHMNPLHPHNHSSAPHHNHSHTSVQNNPHHHHHHHQTPDTAAAVQDSSDQNLHRYPHLRKFIQSTPAQPHSEMPPCQSDANSVDQILKVQSILKQPRASCQNVRDNSFNNSDDLTKTQRVTRVSSLVAQQVLRKELLNMSTALANLRRDSHDVKEGIDRR